MTIPHTEEESGLKAPFSYLLLLFLPYQRFDSITDCFHQLCSRIFNSNHVVHLGLCRSDVLDIMLSSENAAA
jgi:hypothetical protein